MSATKAQQLRNAREVISALEQQLATAQGNADDQREMKRKAREQRDSLVEQLASTKELLELQVAYAFQLSEFIGGFFEAVERALPACCDSQRKAVEAFTPNPLLAAEMKADAVRDVKDLTKDDYFEAFQIGLSSTEAAHKYLINKHADNLIKEAGAK